MAQLSDFLKSGGQAVGDILYTARGDAPAGYIKPEGQFLLQESYPDLFGVIGHKKFDPPLYLNTNNGGSFSSGSMGHAVVSLDGNYLATSKSSGDRVQVHQMLSDGTLSTLTAPPSSGNSPYEVDMDETGTYLAAVDYYSPYVHIWKRSGTTFTKLNTPTPSAHGGAPDGITTACALSPDGVYLVTGQGSGGTAPKLKIFKRTGDTFTRIAGADVQPSGDMNSASFSPDGNFLAVGTGSAPYFEIYKRTGDSFVQQTRPWTPDSYIRDVGFSPDGKYLGAAKGSGSHPRFAVFERSGDTFTKLPMAEPFTENISSYDIDVTGDGFIALSEGSFNGIYLFQIEDGSIYPLDAPSTLPQTPCQAVAFFNGGERFVVGSGTSSQYFYRSTTYDLATEFRVPDLPPSDLFQTYLKAEDV